ncbi:MAG: hypothetical protein Q9163_000787 [Psora crenata]
MIAINNNICVKRQTHPSKTAPIMPSMATTAIGSKKKRPVNSKQLVTSSKAISIPSTIKFPTPATPTRHLFRTPITITTGPQSARFPVHLEILLTISPFFAAAYNPTHTFRESPLNNPSGTLSLPFLHPSDFEYFIQWLYTRTLDHEDLTGQHPAYFKLIRLYGLADELCVTALKNAIVDEMGVVADRTNSCPTPDDTKVVWDDESGCGTSASITRSRRGRSASRVSEGIDDGEEDCADGLGARGGGGGLRELIGDLFVWKKTDRLVEEHQDQWDETFLREVVVKLKREKGRGISAPWRERARGCARYHVHDEWAPICRGVVKGD